MKLFARLRLCYSVLRATRASHWLLLSYACEDAASIAGWARLQRAQQQQEALEKERLQVAAGVRTTREAERLLSQARQLIQPR